MGDGADARLLRRLPLRERAAPIEHLRRALQSALGSQPGRHRPERRQQVAKQHARRRQRAGLEVGHVALDPIAAGQPAVLLDFPGGSYRQPLPSVVSLGQPDHERLYNRGHCGGVIDGALSVRDAELERPETRVRAQLPPPPAGVGERTAGGAPTKRLGVCLPVVVRLDARQAEVLVVALVEGSIRGQRRQQRQEGAGGVVDAQSSVRVADRHVHLESADQLSLCADPVLPDRTPVALQAVELAHPRAERVHTGGGQADQPAGALCQRLPPIAQRRHGVVDRRGCRRHDLDL